MGVRVPSGCQHGNTDGENLTALPPLDEELQMKIDDFWKRKNKSSPGMNALKVCTGGHPQTQLYTNNPKQTQYGLVCMPHKVSVYTLSPKLLSTLIRDWWHMLRISDR